MDELAKKANATVVNNVFHRIEDQTTFDPADESLGLNVEDMNICQTSDSNVMSYCASLHAVRTFGWKGVDKVTVIRNPIDRAWSMYRFSLQGCYRCREMKDVLKTVLNGTFMGRKSVDKNGKERVRDPPDFAYDPNDSCVSGMHCTASIINTVLHFLTNHCFFYTLLNHDIFFQNAIRSNVVHAGRSNDWAPIHKSPLQHRPLQCCQ